MSSFDFFRIACHLLQFFDTKALARLSLLCVLLLGLRISFCSISFLFPIKRAVLIVGGDPSPAGKETENWHHVWKTLCYLVHVGPSKEEEKWMKRRGEWREKMGFSLLCFSLIRHLHTPIINLVCPPRFCISSVFYFSWDDCNTHPKVQELILPDCN